MQLENHPLDRKTIISRQEDDYVINRVITQGDDVQRSSRSITLENMQGFVSEGTYLSNSTPLFLKFKPASLKPYSIALANLHAKGNTLEYVCLLISGSNLLLQRILVKKSLPQDFQLISLDSDAKLCSVFYVSAIAFSLCA